MASTKLQTLVTSNFNANVGAFAGVVIQWTYTVPNGKRSILANCIARVADNANGTNTCVADILVNNVVVLQLWNDGGGNNTLTPFISSAPRINLNEGDTVQGRTTNTGAAAVNMQVSSHIEEYG